MYIYLVKQLNNTFKVAYDSDYEKLRHFPPNTPIKCKFEKERNIKLLKKYFALINLVFQNQERFKNKEELRKALQVSAGFYIVKYDLDGVEYKEPKSISFNRMEEEEFQNLYERVLDQVVYHFKFDKKEIIENLNSFM